MEGNSLPHRPTARAIKTQHTFCRLCEGACGLTVRTDGERIIEVEPDPMNPLSRGFICIKGKNSHRIVDDPARVLSPQRRRDGAWANATWETAFSEIGGALSRIKAAHGPDAIALYIGNPTAMSSTAAFAASAFLRSLGSTRQYSAMSLDNMNKFAVAELVFGDKSFILQRDWECARYMLVLGANPRISVFGQLSTRPRGLEDLRAARARGGKLVLVDPRRTETATVADQHLAITPGTDAYFLLALLRTIITEERYDSAFVTEFCSNFDALAAAVAPYTPEVAAACTGIPAGTIRKVARSFASADGAFALGNTGVSQQRHATVNEWAIAALNAITGNIDRPGGAYYNPGVVDDPHAKTIIDRGRPSRIGGYPRVLGEYPAATLAEEILTPGDRQIRALIVVAGNPLLTGADTARMREALQALDLLVVIDLFRSATAELAHWLLPATSFYERKDLNIQFTRHTPFPFIQHTDRVVAPRGEAREEWDIFRGLHAAVKTPFLADVALDRRAAEEGAAFDVDAFYGSFLEARGRLSLEEIKRHPHGAKVGEKPIGAFRDLLKRRGSRIDLAPEDIRHLLPTVADAGSLSSPEFPLLLISRRNLRSVCSWLHLSDRKNEGNYLEMSAVDAKRLGIADLAMAELRSAVGAITAPVRISDAVGEGVVCLQYGWDSNVRSEDGGSRATMNRLVSADINCDALTGMPTLNGIPVRAAPCQQSTNTRGVER
ncbi:MAG TPA: molybdopterin-dependent oxidoreductase [Hyphomicrobiaceae bacterium]|nr:molybdopterin-dependent oxidoreductase [Hyphomicrobiaceae bacterium]